MSNTPFFPSKMLSWRIGFVVYPVIMLCPCDSHCCSCFQIVVLHWHDHTHIAYSTAATHLHSSRSSSKVEYHVLLSWYPCHAVSSTVRILASWRISCTLITADLAAEEVKWNKSIVKRERWPVLIIILSYRMLYRSLYIDQSVHATAVLIGNLYTQRITLYVHAFLL